MVEKGNIIGVDLGGSNIRAGRVIDGEIVKRSKSMTHAKGTEGEVLNKLCEVVNNCFNDETIAIGIGVPSVVDTTRGIVYDVVNIPSWKEVALGELLHRKFGVPIFINNDSNCFVMGEKIYGKGRPYQNIVGMTIGTGMGLGLIVNGKLHDGRNCCAGEFGMIQYLDENYEYYCSGQYFSNFEHVEAVEIHKKAAEGNDRAIKVFADFGKHIGSAIKAILYAYDPDIIIIGGSLSKAFPFFKDQMYREVEGFAYRNTLQNLKIEISEMEEPAILGAAALVENGAHCVFARR